VKEKEYYRRVNILRKLHPPFSYYENQLGAYMPENVPLKDRKTLAKALFEIKDFNRSKLFWDSMDTVFKMLPKGSLYHILSTNALKLSGTAEKLLRLVYQQQTDEAVINFPMIPFLPTVSFSGELQIKDSLIPLVHRYLASELLPLSAHVIPPSRRLLRAIAYLQKSGYPSSSAEDEIVAILPKEILEKEIMENNRLKLSYWSRCD